jgi:hypothetical protein
MTLYETTVAAAQKEFPKFSVKSYTDNWFFGTLWKMGWRMGATTMYNTIYMDPALIGNDRAAMMLEHELVHVRDQHRWNILFFISYWVPPIGPSFKALWEWRAYKVDLQTVAKTYATEPSVLNFYADWVTSQFTGTTYMWMWPFKKTVRGWCDKVLAGLK